MKMFFLSIVCILTLCFVWCAPALAQFKAQDIQTYTLSGGGGSGNQNCSSAHNNVTPPGWEWQWNVNPLCLWIDSPLITSPSLDNQAREYQFTWTNTCGASCGSLFHAKINNAGDTSEETLSSWSWSIWVYYPNLTNVNQLEFDFNQVVSDGDTIIMAAQCSFAASGGRWEIFNGWPVTTTLSCPKSQWLNTAGSFGGWHHVVISAHRATGSGCGTVGACNLTYDSISFDNVSTACSAFTSGCTRNGADTLGWSAGDLVDNVQVDVSSASGSYTFYTDQMITASPQNPTVANPTFNPVAGTYSGAQSVTISDATGGSTICYTKNGTAPTTNGGGTCTGSTLTYSSPVNVASSETLRAIGTEDGYIYDSAIVNAAYIITSAVSGSSAVTGNFQVAANAVIQ
jgi:hypothetical protein